MAGGRWGPSRDDKSLRGAGRQALITPGEAVVFCVGAQSDSYWAELRGRGWPV